MEDVGLLFKSEQFASVKQAPKLTAKSCWYLKLKQRTSSDYFLVCGKFSMSIHPRRVYFSGIICHFLYPTMTLGSPFLSRIVDWLEHWSNIPDKFGKLSPQTLVSTIHTTVCLPKILNYLTKVVVLIIFLVYFCKMTHLSIISAYTECYWVHSIKSLLVKLTRVSVVLKFLVFSNFFPNNLPSTARR